jgi:hypothetical protein
MAGYDELKDDAQIGVGCRVVETLFTGDYRMCGINRIGEATY